jgi:hypothetical protein
MKRALLSILVPALLVALGFAQTPAASVNTDQTNLKGCLGGSDGSYTVVQDNTGRIFKITTSGVDLNSHLGHDVTLIGHRASGVSPAAADNSFVVTELNMISEHCTVAAAAPIAAASTPSETASTPPASVTAPVATTSTVAENSISPAPSATPPAEAVVTPDATAAPPAEIVVTPAATATAPAEVVVTPAATATPPAEVVVTPAATATPSAEVVVSTPSESASTPPARPRRRSETPDAAATAPDVTPSSSSETASTPAAADTPPVAAASSSSDAASTPAAADTTPAAPARHGALLLLILVAVLIIVLGTMVPVFSRWRKRKLLERTGAQNLSFSREESSDKNKSDQAGPRRAA